MFVVPSNMRMLLHLMIKMWVRSIILNNASSIYPGCLLLQNLNYNEESCKYSYKLSWKKPNCCWRIICEFYKVWRFLPKSLKKKFLNKACALFQGNNIKASGINFFLDYHYLKCQAKVRWRQVISQLMTSVVYNLSTLNMEGRNCIERFPSEL